MVEIIYIFHKKYLIQLYDVKLKVNTDVTIGNYYSWSGDYYTCFSTKYIACWILEIEHLVSKPGILCFKEGYQILCCWYPLG